MMFGMCCSQGVLADVSIATGYVTIALMVSGRFIFQYFGWATAAFITPTVLMLFGGAFFAFTLTGTPATASWAVLAGAVTQVCTHIFARPLFLGPQRSDLQYSGACCMNTDLKGCPIGGQPCAVP